MSPNARNMGGFPSRTRVTLKYVDVFTLNPPAGLSDSFAYSLRNLFDPDTRIGGHQPSNYDKWMTIYERWSVIKTKVKMTSAWTSTSSVQPCFFGFLISKDGNDVPALSLNSVLEQPFARYADSLTGLANAQPLLPSLTATVPSRDWLGLDEEKQLLDLSYSGIDASGSLAAAQDVFCEVFCYTPPGGAAPASVLTFKIELEFDCVLQEPKPTVPS